MKRVIIVISVLFCFVFALTGVALTTQTADANSQPSNSCCLAAPSLKSPGNGACISNPKPCLDWGCVAKASSYEVQVSRNPMFCGSPVIKQVVKKDCFQVCSPLCDGIYFWRVRALQGCCQGPWSPVGCFTVDTKAPCKPSLLCPVGAIYDSKPLLVWCPVGVGIQYEVKICGPNGYFRCEKTGNSCLKICAPLCPGKYEWQVRAIDCAGNKSAWNCASFCLKSLCLPCLPSNGVPG